jgi:hypothetical protein
MPTATNSRNSATTAIPLRHLSPFQSRGSCRYKGDTERHIHPKGTGLRSFGHSGCPDQWKGSKYIDQEDGAEGGTNSRTL